MGEATFVAAHAPIALRSPVTMPTRHGNLFVSVRVLDTGTVFVIAFDSYVDIFHRLRLPQNQLSATHVLVLPEMMDDVTVQPQVKIAFEDEDASELTVTTLPYLREDEDDARTLRGARFIKVPKDDGVTFPTAKQGRKLPGVYVSFDFTDEVPFGHALEAGDHEIFYLPHRGSRAFLEHRRRARKRLQGKTPAVYTDRDFADAACAGNRYLLRMASDPTTRPEHLAKLAECGWLPVLRRIARNPQTSVETLAWVGSNGLFPAHVARNPALELILLTDPDFGRTVDINLGMALQSNEDDDRESEEELSLDEDD